MMNIENKSPKEIQQEIFDAVKNGRNIDDLKKELRNQGVITEGYYFTTEADRQAVLEEPKAAAGALTGKQIFWGILTIVILIIKVARCTSKMNHM